MIDKEKIRAEIDRLLDVIAETKVDTPDRLIMASSQVKVLLDLKKFIDSLPEEPVSESLEEAARKQATLHSPLEEKARELAIAYFNDINGQARCEAACQEIANWQKEQMIDKACEWLETINIDYYQIREGVFSKELVIDFRKAMEAEK